MTRMLPVLALFLALPFSLFLSLPLHAKEAAPDWKAQVRAGVEAWDAGRAEEAEKTLKSAVAAAEKVKSLPPDTGLALAHQILSHAGETRWKQSKKKATTKEKTEAAKHFQKAKDILLKAWATGAGEQAIQPLLVRAQERRKKYCFAETASLQRLVLEVVEVRAPGSMILVYSLNAHGFALQYLGQFPEAEGQYGRAIALCEKLHDPNSASAIRQGLAGCYLLEGRYREAADLYQRAIRELENMGSDAPPRDLGFVLRRLAHVSVLLGDEAQTEALCQRAFPLLEKLAQQEMEMEKADPKKKAVDKRDLLARLLTTWGDLRRNQGRFEEALAFYGRALNAYPLLLDTPMSVATLWQVQGRLQEAEKFARSTLESMERVSGADHYSTAPSRTRLASICFAAGKDKEAEALLRKSLKVQEEVLGPQHPDAAETADILGTLLYARGGYAEAETLFQSALEGRIEALGEEHALVSETLGHQGELYMVMSRFKDAEVPYRKALALDETRLGPEHPGVGLRCRRLGQCLLTQGKFEEAEPYLSRALRIDEAAFGADHPALEQDLEALSKLFKTKGDSGKQAEMTQRIETGRAKAAEETLKPTAPAEPLIEVPATPEGLQGALRRGLGYLSEARGAMALDFDTKRRAYTDAEAAFGQAMKALETMKAAGTGPADADEQAAQIRTFLFECHKCKPLGGVK